jgi:bacteriorhodopsin
MGQKRSWADMSAAEKTGLVILGTLQVGLLALTLWDIAHRTDDEVRGDRRMWAGLAFINWLGPLAYFTIGRKQTLTTLKSWCDRSRCSDTQAVEAKAEQV